MKARYDGKCEMSGEKITAGESEIRNYGGCWVLAEYASKETQAEVAERIIARINELAQNIKGEHALAKIAALIEFYHSSPAMARLEMLKNKQADLETRYS